jgi:hypothetical protein
MANKRISELEEMSMSKLPKLKSKEEKEGKNQSRIPKTCGIPAKGVTYI